MTENFFSEGEYILADSAYAVTKNIIPIIKRQGRTELSDEQKRFNLAVSRTRIAVEHAFGILKTRFQCLRELRINIDTEQGLQRAFLFIEGAVIVNNFLIDQHDEAVFEGQNMDVLRRQWSEEARAEDARVAEREQQQEQTPIRQRARSQATTESAGSDPGLVRDCLMARCEELDYGPAYQDESDL